MENYSYTKLGLELFHKDCQRKRPLLSSNKGDLRFLLMGWNGVTPPNFASIWS